ncbi:hypothetical protein KM043_004782 [Ampulex compressa]|nr:hypothetical protein KM043_004782 [Ampulex compressa]
MILFGAKTLKNFKEGFRIYETIQKKNFEKLPRGREGTARRMDETRKWEHPKKTETTGRPGTLQATSETKCYNCGTKGHISRDCRRKDLGQKCFKCNTFGHKASACNYNNENGQEITALAHNISREGFDTFSENDLAEMIEEETVNDSDIINNLIDYEDGQEEPDSITPYKIKGFPIET